MNVKDDSNVAPLAGLRVLEFSHTIMGPCAGLLLADLGADVIKVEPAPNGDKTRYLPGFAAGFFATFNRNKRSIALNLKTDEGQAVVHELIKSADVVLDNYGPGTMAKLGCDWPVLKAINSRLIYLSLKGFLKGPWQDRPALDEVVQFRSGLAYMTGPPGQPLRAGASIVDILGAVFGVTGVLAALRERDRTGQGQRVGSSLFESAAFMMASHIAGGAAMGEEVPPMTARKGAWGVYDVFKSQDNEPLFIGVTSDSQWERFCDVFELRAMKEDVRLATNPERTIARVWLLPKLSKHFSTMTLEAMVEGCERADVSWSPVGRPEELVSNEQLQEPGGLLDTVLSGAQCAANGGEAHQVNGALKVQLPGLPLEFGDERRRTDLRLQPPQLGEHTQEILLENGFSSARIDRLMASCVVV
jgi:crotonobetainyl-CoA:carnitine CoA-transferase CaiB-like acyl-CoA transferase